MLATTKPLMMVAVCYQILESGFFNFLLTFLNVPLNTAAGTVPVGDREVTFLLEIFGHLDFLCFGDLV